MERNEFKTAFAPSTFPTFPGYCLGAGALGRSPAGIGIGGRSLAECCGSGTRGSGRTSAVFETVIATAPLGLRDDPRSGVLWLWSLLSRAAESESESTRVGSFARSRSQRRLIFTDSDSGPESEQTCMLNSGHALRSRFRFHGKFQELLPIPFPVEKKASRIDSNSD